jgi:UDP-N-acetylmuramyl pentapeptide synthase
MQKILLYILQFLAKLIIKKHKPFVIGITGTVGKTTTAHFVYHFLHNLY